MKTANIEAQKIFLVGCSYEHPAKGCYGYVLRDTVVIAKDRTEALEKVRAVRASMFPARRAIFHNKEYMEEPTISLHEMRVIE